MSPPMTIRDQALLGSAGVSGEDYPDGLGTGGDGLVYFSSGTPNPNRTEESAGSNLPIYSWRFTQGDNPKIVTAFTTNMGTQFSFAGWVNVANIQAYSPLLCGKGSSDGSEEFRSYTGSSADNGSFGGDALNSENMGPSVDEPQAGECTCSSCQYLLKIIIN